MRKNRDEIIDYINMLSGYEGYVQFSHRAIDLDNDIFPRSSDISNEDGFVYEAHFFKDNESVMIRQVNDAWLCSKTDLSEVEDKDKETFYAIAGLKVNMAQIWEAKEDELCEGMEVLKLQKVVFAGFSIENKGEKND